MAGLGVLMVFFHRLAAIKLDAAIDLITNYLSAVLITELVTY